MGLIPLKTHVLSTQKVLGSFVRKSSESFFVVMEKFCILIGMMVINSKHVIKFHRTRGMHVCVHTHTHTHTVRVM